MKTRTLQRAIEAIPTSDGAGVKLRRSLGYGDYVALGLETAAEFWQEDRERARLLLEGGPAFSG